MNTLRIAGRQVLHPDAAVEDTDVLVDRGEGTILNIGAGLDADVDGMSDVAGCLVASGLVSTHYHVAMMFLRGYTDDKSLDAWLRKDIWPTEGALTPEDVHAGVELGFVEITKSEAIGFADICFHAPETVAAIEEAGLHVCLGHGVVTFGKDDADTRANIDESLDVAREFNGAADGRVWTTTILRSLMMVVEKYLHKFAIDTHDGDIPVHYHANETTDKVDPIVGERGKRPLSHTRDLGIFTADDFLAHGVRVDDTEIDLSADAGTGVVHCPASNMKLVLGMAPVQKLPDVGITVGLDTDGAASNNDLGTFNEMRGATMLGKLAAGDANAVATPDVVRMVTASSAAAVNLPGGAFKIDDAADLVVIDLDAPHLTPVNDFVSRLAYAARDSDTHHTIRDGRVLMWNREMLTLGEDAVMACAREAIASLRERV